MKKLFSEPEIEILNFLCSDQGYDSPTLEGGGVSGGGMPGGEDVDENGMPT